jgi:hypothetical protein
MTTRSSIAVDEARIRELIDAWAKALRAKDINGIMSHYAVDIVTFGLAPPAASLARSDGGARRDVDDDAVGTAQLDLRIAGAGVHSWPCCGKIAGAFPHTVRIEEFKVENTSKLECVMHFRLDDATLAVSRLWTRGTLVSGRLKMMNN